MGQENSPHPYCPNCNHDLLYQGNVASNDTELPDGTFDLDCLSCGCRLHEAKDGQMTIAENT